MRAYKIWLIIIVLVIGASIAFTLLTPHIVNNNTSTVDKYDTVKIDYIVWESDNLRRYDTLNPLLDTVLWVTMIPITENNTTGLILGLYNSLLEKKLYYKSDLIWLDACIDENRDGIDDITNATALTYGNSTDQYYNTCLMIQFKVLDIKKASAEPEESTLPTLPELLFWLHPLLILFISVFLSFIFELIVQKQLISKIDIRKLGRGLFKYGLMIGICTAIPFIAFGIINLTATPEGLSLLKTRYDFFIPLIIILIVGCCIVFIISYLFIWKSRKRH